MRDNTEPITVLVIGPSQNGKSTFINRVIDIAESAVSRALEGNGNEKCTVNSQIFDLDVPLTEYYLEDRETGKPHDVPRMTDEAQILKDAWYRKQTRNRYEIKPVDGHCPSMKLRLIDTPGLDDSEGKDFENMADILEILNKLSKSPVVWETKIHAIVFIYNSENAFSHSFQGVVKDYYRCMPNLFGGLCVINTHFNTSALSKKRANFIQNNIIGAGDNARQRIIKERAREFAKILGEGFNPTHFFVDSKPNGKQAYEDLVSRNTITDILTFWAGSKAMPISQMRLIKNREMQSIDNRLQILLIRAIDKWKGDLHVARENASEHEAFKATLLQRKEELENNLARLQEDLDRLDNDTEYTIETWTSKDDASAWELLGRSIIRRRIKKKVVIRQPEYPNFKVSAEDSISGSWISKGLVEAGAAWAGEYEGKVGRIPHLVVRCYTTNREKYRARITEFRTQLRRDKARLAENQDTWNSKMNGQVAEPDHNSKLDNLVVWIEAGNNMVALLEQETPPVDKAFDGAARARYSKSPRDIRVRHLFDFVKGAKPDLLVPLREALAVDWED
ncbi:hypothetical protein E0Z10_g5512 [Xylaria hypoxylon]|uniref:G domain-containing protein n=1 Tax=Xylaria hypoxylon TaxID=37992 RepID=A0A4Z0Z3M2_9PEZI|nr:hypothetical protein E0Z10_g5512 [Xylaria hypoxylon]